MNIKKTHIHELFLSKTRGGKVSNIVFLGKKTGCFTQQPSWNSKYSGDDTQGYKTRCHNLKLWLNLNWNINCFKCILVIVMHYLLLSKEYLRLQSQTWSSGEEKVEKNMKYFKLTNTVCQSYSAKFPNGPQLLKDKSLGVRHPATLVVI